MTVMIAVIKGMEFRHGATEAFRALPPKAVLEVKRDPGNPYDKNAVAVFLKGTKTQLGFIAAQDAKVLAPLMDAGMHMTAQVRNNRLNTLTITWFTQQEAAFLY